ncbi:MAG TPA: hypothetical protein PKZ92_03860, partial [Candidatus Woesebacteria bacterium]|nr:hypothetical protein [Candidatus Woesebacteria bacterium]
VPPPSEKMLSGFQQAGKKEGGLGEGIFARLLSAPKARQGWEAARPCVSKEAKPAKIVSLIEKEFCARPLKEKEIFAGFVSAFGGASRWGGFLPVRAESFAQNGFALRSVIATKSVYQVKSFSSYKVKIKNNKFSNLLDELYEPST